MLLKSLIDLLHANVVLVGLLVGAVTPLLTSVVQQPHWSRRVRVIVAVVVSVVIGFIIAASSGSLDPGNLLGVLIAVYTAAEAFYQKVWSPSGVSGAVERATTLPSRQTGPDSFEAYVPDNEPGESFPPDLEFK